SDWTDLGGCWGRPGVCAIFDYLRVAGIKDVYWRVFNGGLAMYPSKVAQVQDRRGYDEWKAMQLYPQPTVRVEYLKALDFNTCDPVADAVEIAKEFGINLHLWYSIYEDDHGGAFLCDFAREHPEYWQQDREGRSYRGTLDFFYEEVRSYKQAIIDELLAYETKGLLLDFVRHNACPSADRDGIHRFGYNPAIRDHYRETHGTDPMDLPPDNEQWLTFKREIMTTFLHEVRTKMDCTETCRELSLMLWPVDYSRWACLDVPRLTEERVVQMVCMMSLKYSRSPQEAIDQYHIMQPQVRNPEVAILPGLCCYDGIYPGHVNACVDAAEKAGIEEMMLFEADSLSRFNLACSVRAINLGLPNYKRTLTATRVPTTNSDDLDWSVVPVFSDFLFNSGVKPEEVPSERTEVQIAYDEAAVVFRFTCYDSAMEVALSPREERPEQQYYLDALGPRTQSYYINSFNVFLDAHHSHQSFHHFGVSPTNERAQETFLDTDWDGEWESSVTAEANRWIGWVRVPYHSLGITPPATGDEWGVNLLRGIRAKEETSIWFYILWSLPFPDDMGHLKFVRC
ncbi:MAG: hypothetical protein HY318_11085, partial [Armatimonadetes bacterium]|nr:hypothetical protein [Armatimonadota bacterium]